MSKSKSHKSSRRKSSVRKQKGNSHQNLHGYNCAACDKFKIEIQNLRESNDAFVQIMDIIRKENVRLAELLLDQKEEKNNSVSSLTDCLDKLNTALSGFINEDMECLSIDKGIENLELSLDKIVENVKEIKKVISSVMKPNVRNYQEWNIKQAIIWIKSLEDGRYAKYCEVLQKGFQSDGITPSILPQISQDVLRHDPFNIIFFPDRQCLANHFKSLLQQNVEGTMTEYH